MLLILTGNWLIINFSAILQATVLNYHGLPSAGPKLTERIYDSKGHIMLWSVRVSLRAMNPNLTLTLTLFVIV